MCECRTNTTSRLTDHFAKNLPEGSTNLSVNMDGYGLIMSGSTMRSKNVCPVTVQYQVPTKAGGWKNKKEKTSMVGNYCMFCGEKYEKDEAADID